MENDVKKIHFVGIGGVGMGSFAVALAEAGYTVTGSDGKLYEPMKGVLASANIGLIEGFQPSTLERVQPDLVVIGNVVRKENEEVRAWLKQGTPFLSFPEAVRRFLIGDKNSVVVAGTHGKTTTTTWISYLFSELGMDPTYLIGGVPKDLPRGCKLTTGQVFVGEGDEYDSAFFDKGPKFLHYNPHFLVLTSIEFDHADIYKDLAHVQASFEKLVALLPGDGLCVARYDDPVVMEVATNALCPVQTFGIGAGAMWRLGKVEQDTKGYVFEAIYKGRSIGTFRSPAMGEHNLLNILSGVVCAVNLGQSVEKIRPIIESFHGGRRRQEILLETPVVGGADFAHQPTEGAATLKAVRARFPQGKVWAFFEPRSATARRAVHQEAYAKSFDSADHILLAVPFKAKDLEEGERFSSDTLVTELKARGKAADTFPGVDAMIQHFLQGHSPGDIAVVMSNGEFDKIQEKLVKSLAS